MPKRNFFGRLFAGVGRFIKNIFGKARKIVNDIVPVGIEIVEKLKYFVDSPVSPIITALIPGVIDDVAFQAARRIIPDVLAKLQIAGDIAANNNTPDEILQATIAALRKLDPDARKGYYLTIASMISQALTKESDGGEKLTWAEFVMITQYLYTQEYNKKQNK